MSTSKKLLLIIVFVMSIVAISSVLIFSYNFKYFSSEIAIDKASSIAKNVRDGLTSHMINGTMDKREQFLLNIKKHQDISNFHLLRTNTVIKQFGKGFKNELKPTAIEQKVIQTKKQQSILLESFDKVLVNISIPYIATNTDTPNCMQCHKANEGDVLGVISMEIDITNVRSKTIDIITQILLMIIAIIILSMIIVQKFLKPYTNLFEDLETSIIKAYNGDFSSIIQTNIKDEAGVVAHNLNNLLEIYRFKNTIELDENKIIVYDRIKHILKAKFNINHFTLFEIDHKTKKRNIIFDTNNLTDIDYSSYVCRAFRTKEDVSSSEFDNICLNCKQKQEFYICLNFLIDDNYSLILHLSTSTQEKLEYIKKHIPIIKNYFNMAKPVIESKILMDELRNTTLKDPMTTLYNRRFLDEVLDSHVTTRVKEGFIHSLLMIDIDFFKKVNDSYGHDIGDTVIKALAKIMKSSIRDSDMAVRYGGEEFIIVLLNSTQDHTLRIAQNIRKVFKQELFKTASYEEFSKTLSIGISHYPKDTKKLWEAIKFADEALYVAKNNGRDQVVEFKPEMHTTGEDY